MWIKIRKIKLKILKVLRHTSLAFKWEFTFYNNVGYTIFSPFDLEVPSQIRVHFLSMFIENRLFARHIAYPQSPLPLRGRYFILILLLRKMEPGRLGIAVLPLQWFRLPRFPLMTINHSWTILNGTFEK